MLLWIPQWPIFLLSLFTLAFFFFSPITWNEIFSSLWGVSQSGFIFSNNYIEHHNGPYLIQLFLNVSTTPNFALDLEIGKHYLNVQSMATCMAG